MPEQQTSERADQPPLLMTGEKGSFAYRTMTTRIPEIVQNILADFADTLPGESKQALHGLLDELLQNRPVQPPASAAPDAAGWTEAWRPYQGRRWFELPWYFAETLFYRRLLEAFGYFGRDEWAGVDPFLPRKRSELHGQTPWQILAMALNFGEAYTADSFRSLLHLGVWGNRLDLSYSKVAKAAGRQIELKREAANLLVDQTEAVWHHLQHREAGRIDFICDNAGAELLMDLALADFLLRFERASQISLHVKAHPTYVSDTTPADVELTIAAAGRRPEAVMAALAGRLESFRHSERLRVQADLFWNSSHFFREMQAGLRAELEQAYLVVVKGDANYRRLIGDRRWPTTLPLADLTFYFPAPLVTLRTMKSDPVVGLGSGQAERLDWEDAEWRVNGKRGVIQAVL